MTALCISKGDVLDIRTYSILWNLYLLREARHLLSRLGTVHIRRHGPWRWLYRRRGLGELHMWRFKVMLHLTKMRLDWRTTRCMLRCRSLRHAAWALKVRR